MTEQDKRARREAAWLWVVLLVCCIIFASGLALAAAALLEAT
jgi:hypothetical protein